MEDQARGRWVLWGTSAHTDVNSLIMQSIGSALSGALTRLQDGGSTVDEGAHAARVPPGEDDGRFDCGEGDLSAEVDDAALIARIQEQDPQWTPPGEIGADGRTSWMEVVREMTEREVETAVSRRAARGSIRLG